MKTASILEEINERGILLTVASDGIHYKAKPGTITPELIEGIREHRAEIVAALKSDVVARQRWGMPPHEEFILAEYPPELSEDEKRLVIEATERQPPEVIAWALDQAGRYEDARRWPPAVCDIAGALDVLLWQQEQTSHGRGNTTRDSVRQSKTREEQTRGLIDLFRDIEEIDAFLESGSRK